MHVCISLVHEPGHASMAGVAERGDGRADFPQRARCDRAALLYSPIKEKAKNRKCCRFITTAALVSSPAALASPPTLFRRRPTLVLPDSSFPSLFDRLGFNYLATYFN